MIQSQFWQEFQSRVTATHTIQQLQSQTRPKGEIPIAFVLKTLISVPFPCGNSVPQAVTESVPPAAEAQSRNHWTTGEVWKSSYFHTHYIRTQMITA